jgi:hypothetical protein
MTQLHRPLQAVPCRCDHPIADDGSCLRCGHRITALELVAWSPSADWLSPEENTPLRRAA